MSSHIDEETRMQKDVKGVIWVLVPLLAALALVAAVPWPEFTQRAEKRLDEARGDITHAVRKLSNPPVG